MQSLLVTIMRVPFVFHPIAIVRVMKRNKKRSITVVIFCSQIKREGFLCQRNQFDGENERKTIFYDREDTRSQSLPLTTAKTDNLSQKLSGKLRK